MALRRPIKCIRFFQPKTFNPSHLIPFFLHTEKDFYPQNPFTKPNPITQIRKIHHSSSVTANIPSNRNEIVEELISIFTNRSLIQESEELQILGSRLTPEIVETVLRGLKSWKIAQKFFSWATEQYGYKHNCYTYNTMASIFSRARQTTQLRILAIDMVNSRCFMTPGALGFFIRCLGSLGLVEEANSFFEQAKMMSLCVVNNYSYNCLLEVLAKSSRVELVEMRLKEMGALGWDSDKFTWTPVLQAYCNAGKFEEALYVFNQIFDKGFVDEHVFTILALSFSKWGKVDEALELIQRMEDHNMRLNEKTLCVLIHGFTRESRVDKALQLFDKMRKLDFRPDISIYSVLIKGLCKKKELGKALDLYVEMKNNGIFPDVDIIRNLISSFCGEGDLATANQLIEESEERFDVEAMVVLHNVVLNGLVSKGMADEAYLLLREMMGGDCSSEAAMDKDNLFRVKKKVLLSPDSFIIVIDGLCKIGKLDVALSLFHDMVRVGCERNLLLYNNLIHELCNLDRLEEGFELLKEMKESGFEPTRFTHNSIYGCLCRRENTLGALDLMREMRSCGHDPWIKHSTMLVKQLCTHGKVVEACNFLNGMVQEGFLPDIIAYSAAIDGLFKISEIDQALKLFQEVSARGYRLDLIAYNILIRGLCNVGKISEAEDFLNDMLEKGLLPSVVTYNLMIDGLCKANELDRALLYFKRIVDEAREPTIITYTTLIDGLCNAGRPDDALILWNEMGEKRCSPNRIAYMAFVHGLCKCSMLDAALIYFKEMKEKEMRPDAFVYVAIISGFVSNKNPLVALEILKEMVQQGNFPGPSDKNYPILLDAVCKLSEDENTSSDVKNLTVKGHLPVIYNVFEKGVRDGFEPIG